MIPKEAMFIALFTMVADVSMHNTYAALILPRIAAPLGVFLMTQFFSQVPLEVEEAARIDGAGPWRTFFSVMLPLARPSMIALGIFTFVQTWNDYLWPLVSATKSEMFTITTGLASLQGNFAQATELGSLMARGLVGSLPLLLVFIFFRRHLIRGISHGLRQQVGTRRPPPAYTSPDPASRPTAATRAATDNNVHTTRGNTCDTPGLSQSQRRWQQRRCC